MDVRQERKLNDYLEVLFWMETASVDEIKGTLSFASDVTKQELQRALRCLMTSYRPALALHFLKLSDQGA